MEFSYGKKIVFGIHRKFTYYSETYEEMVKLYYESLKLCLRILVSS